MQSNELGWDAQTIHTKEQTGWGPTDNPVKQTNRLGMHRQSR